MKKIPHKQINLALQGGGAHGAYTWGVLDRLLEDEFLTIDTISGTSAGAVNAVALAQGFMEDGVEGARYRITEVWRSISKAGDFVSIPTNPMEMMNKAMKGFFQPFDHNPFDLDPLRGILKNHIDFDALRKHSSIGVHVAATQATTGKSRIFTAEELSLEAVMASSCLPMISTPVIIDGESYFDGGFSANPALRPVILNSNTDDTMLVQLSPVDEFDIKTHMSGMSNQLSFSQSLRREIELVEDHPRYQTHHFHLIDGTAVTAKLNPGSEMTPNWPLLSELYHEGRDGAEAFLASHRTKIGSEASINLKEHFRL